MTITTLAASGALALLLWSGSSQTGNAPTARVAAVLVQEFETVVQASPALLSSTGEASKQLSRAESANLRFPFAYLSRALDSLPRPASTIALSSAAAVFVGAKDFRAPARLGAVRSQRCYVVALDSQSRFDIRTYVSAAPVATAAGAPVWHWVANLQEFGEGDPQASSLYASQIDASHVLVSNDLGVLQRIAKGLTGADPSSAVPDIQDWAAIAAREEWAYRRYRHAGVVDRNAAGLTNVTATADALIFYLSSDRKSGVLRLLASDASTVERLNRSMEKSLEWPPLKPSGPGVWETVVRFTGDDASGQRVFVIFGLLGFATFL